MNALEDDPIFLFGAKTAKNLYFSEELNAWLVSGSVTNLGSYQDLGSISSSQLISWALVFRVKKCAFGDRADGYKWSDMGHLGKWPKMN